MMKRFLSVLLSVCLVFTLCISSFAASIDIPSSVTDKIEEAVGSLSDSSTDEEVTAAAQEVIAAIQETGASTKTEILQVADRLYDDGVITEEVYNEIYLIVQSDSFDPADNQTSNIMDEITAIIEDDSKSTEEKITAVVSILLSLPSSQAQSILDKLYEQGVIDDSMYNQISDLLNSEITVPSIGSGDDSSSGSTLSGIFDTILGLLGLGGGSSSGDDDDNTTTTTSASSSSSSSSSYEGKTATGDYAIPAVAAVALAAGIALVLTKKKK